MNVNKLLIGGLIIGIGAILLLTTKIGSKTDTKQSTTIANSPSTNSTTTTQTITIGSIAPDFTLTNLDKETFRLGDKKGKTIILFGMAGWCGTCIAEGKVLTKIKTEYADKGVEVIGVAFTEGDNEDFLREFKRLGQIDIPLALDTDNVAGKYNLTRLETTYIINKEGIIVYTDEQNTSEEIYRKELEKIL